MRSVDNGRWGHRKEVWGSQEQVHGLGVGLQSWVELRLCRPGCTGAWGLLSGGSAEVTPG